MEARLAINESGLPLARELGGGGTVYFERLRYVVATPAISAEPEITSLALLKGTWNSAQCERLTKCGAAGDHTRATDNIRSDTGRFFVCAQATCGVGTTCARAGPWSLAWDRLVGRCTAPRSALHQPSQEMLQHVLKSSPPSRGMTKNSRRVPPNSPGRPSPGLRCGMLSRQG